MGSDQPFAFLDSNKTGSEPRIDSKEDNIHDPFEFTEEDLNDIEENGFYLKNVQGVLKFDIPGGKRKRFRAKLSHGVNPGEDFESEETNSAQSDTGGKSPARINRRDCSEEYGGASSTETMSSEDESNEPVTSVTPSFFHNKEGYKCNDCDFWNNSYETMQLHYKIVHLRFDSSETLSAEHTEISTGEDNSNSDYLFELSQQAKECFNCPFCLFSCSFKSQMCRHIRNDHGEEILLECDAPQADTVTIASSTEDSLLDQSDFSKENDFDMDLSPIASRLRRRRRIQFDSIAKEHSILARILEERHQDPNRFTCELCDFKSSFRYAIISHFEVRHSAKRIYTCDSCEYLTHSEYFLKRHSNSKHSEKKVYKCKSCDYSSARRYTMRSHIDSVHKKIKPFSCSQCSYSAARRDALKMHVTAIHEGKRPFSCNECSFSSSRKYLLKNHVKSYHGPCAQEELEKMFTCAVCGFVAKTSTTLKEHLSDAHGGSTKSTKDSEDASSYSCDLCNFKCHRRTNLYSHRKAMHAGPDASRKHPCPFCFYFAYKITGLKGHITKCHKDCSYTDIDRIINGR